MKVLKRLAALSLSVLMCTALFSGCGGNDSSQSTKSESNTSQAQNSGEPVHIKWYAVCAPGPQADVKTVEEAIDDHLSKTYNMNIDLELVYNTFKDNAEKMPVIIGSGEEYDICWTSSWNNNYYTNVNKNAFIALDDLLQSDAPELYKSIDKEIWDGTRVKGKIYGVPSIQIMCKQNYISIVKDYVDKYNFDISKANSLDDFDEFFHQIKKDNPDIYPFVASSSGLQGKLNLALGYEEIAGVKIPGAFKIGDESITVVNQYELDSTKNFFSLMHKWSKDGIIRQDAATVENNGFTEMKAGKHAANVAATYKPGADVTDKANFGGNDLEFAMLSEPYSATSSIVSSLNAISQTSKNPEVAMKFLELANTDATLFNMLALGIEGKHYTKNSDGTVTPNESAGYFLNNADWVFGNQFNALFRQGQATTIWDETKELNKKSVKSYALGFSFDSTTVTTEIAAVTKAVDQYSLALDTGAVDPAVVLPQMLEKMKAAGSDKIIAEMQKQVNEWRASKK